MGENSHMHVSTRMMLEYEYLPTTSRRKTHCFPHQMAFYNVSAVVPSGAIKSMNKEVEKVIIESNKEKRKKGALHQVHRFTESVDWEKSN